MAELTGERGTPAEAPDLGPNAVPDRIAIDAKGYGWRVWDEHPEMWSMVPQNPDNSPIPEPLTWFVRLNRREDALLAAMTAGLCTNGAVRLLEVVGIAGRREALACFTGMLQAAADAYEAALFASQGGPDGE